MDMFTYYGHKNSEEAEIQFRLQMISGLHYLCRFNRSVISTPTPECEESVFNTASQVPHSSGLRGGGEVWRN